jgi:hypothetical protein
MTDVTQILNAIEAGDAQAAEQLPWLTARIKLRRRRL